MIVIEGPDCAGKTSLAKAICKKFKANYYHFDKPAPGVHHVEQFIEALESQPYNTVFDRGCLSGLVYDFKRFGDPSYSTTSLDEIRWGLQHMAKSKALLCYVTASEDILLERLAKETDDFVDSAELVYASKIYELLWRFVREQPWAIYGGPSLGEYNTTNRSTKDILKASTVYFGSFLND